MGPGPRGGAAGGAAAPVRFFRGLRVIAGDDRAGFQNHFVNRPVAEVDDLFGMAEGVTAVRGRALVTGVGGSDCVSERQRQARRPGAGEVVLLAGKVERSPGVRDGGDHIAASEGERAAVQLAHPREAAELLVVEDGGRWRR